MDVNFGLSKKLNFNETLTSVVYCEVRQKIFAAGDGFLTEYDILNDSSKIYNEFYNEYCICLTHDKTRLVMGNWRGRLSIFDLNTNTTVSLDELLQEGYFYYLTISKNDQYAASSGYSKFIHVLDLRTNKIIFRFLRNSSPDLKLLLFDSQDSHLISSYECKYVSVWDLTSGEQMILGKHNFCIVNANMTASRQKFVTFAKDGGLVWDGINFLCLYRIPGHSLGVIGAVMDDKKEKLITSGEDNTIRFWDLHTKQETNFLPTIAKMTGLRIIYNKYIIGCNALNFFVFFYKA